MKRNQVNILQNADGVIFAYTDNTSELLEYITKATNAGFTYSSAENGIAVIYTFYKNP